MNYYRQCELNGVEMYPDRDGGQIVWTTTWIPEQFAFQGNKIKLKDADTIWNVISVGVRAPEDQVLERERDYKHQRKASDI